MERLIGAVSAMALVLIAMVPAQAQNAEKPFYQGKTIRIIIPYPPGGSFDRYARIASEYMGSYIPGNPAIITQNKDGIAGTLLDFTSHLPDDGTYMAIFPETIGIDQLVAPATSPWDVRKLAYVGSFANVNSAFFLGPAAKAKSIDDLAKVSTTVGCNSQASPAYANAEMLKNMLGYQFRMVCGYGGNTAFPIALLQGEIDLVMSAWNGWSERAEVKNGTFKPVLQFGLKRHKELPNVPLMQDLVTDPMQKKVLEFRSAGAAIGRALVVRASVPAERIDVLRTAFDKAMKDPALLDEAAKTKLEIDPTPGVDVQRVSDAILDTPKDVVQLAIKAVE